MKRKPDFKIGQKVDDYILEKSLGAGQDGEIWRVTKKPLGKVLAVKFLNSIEQKDKKERFDREIQILSALNHPHIINIFDRGEAWNPTTGKLVPYYVMEFIKALPINDVIKKIPKKEIFEIFFSLINQMASALIEVHNKGITHGDIKSSNILIYPNDRVAKLTDFGFGLLPGETAVERKEYPRSSYHTPEGLSREEADIHKLGRTFKDRLNSIGSKLTGEEIADLDKLLMDMINDPTNISLENLVPRLEVIKDLHYKKGKAYYSKISSLAPEISGNGTDLIIRDPIQGDIHLSKRCSNIIDLLEFQRLRNIKELSPCELVYPTMTQTHFESALGQYGMVGQYLNSLISTPQFQDIVDPIHLRATVLLSLTKEIGQFPYSSQIFRATESKKYDPRIRSASIITKEPLSIIISKYWDLDPDLIGQLLTETHPKANPKPWRLILSILYGPISAPTIDSLMRILWRGSISYNFDFQRFIKSLRVDLAGHRLAMHKEDLPLLESFLLTKYLLLERILWHRTIIAADRMLVYSFLELSKANFDFDLILAKSDWEFLDVCIQRANDIGLLRAKHLLESYSQRRIHKQIATWRLDEIGRVSSILDDLTLSIKLEKYFSKRLKEPFPPGSIIFVSAVPIMFPFDVSYISAKKERMANQASPIIANLIEKIKLDIFSRHRLLASAKVADSLRRLEYKEITEIILGMIQ